MKGCVKKIYKKMISNFRERSCQAVMGNANVYNDGLTGPEQWRIFIIFASHFKTHKPNLDFNIDTS